MTETEVEQPNLVELNVSTKEVKEREKRVTFTSVIASAKNGYIGSITVAVVGIDDPVIFTYKTPELSQFLALAINAGFKERFSIRVASAKAIPEVTDEAGNILTANVSLPEAIKATLVEEEANLSKGIYSSRTVSLQSNKATYTDIVVAWAFSEAFPNITMTRELYSEILMRTELLNEVDDRYSNLTASEKKAKVREFQKLRQGVAFFKDL